MLVEPDRSPATTLLCAQSLATVAAWLCALIDGDDANLKIGGDSSLAGGLLDRRGPQPPLRLAYPWAPGWAERIASVS